VVEPRSQTSGRRLDWPLLVFWVGYLVLFAAGVGMFLR
jgi:hypothetical protein